MRPSLLFPLALAACAPAQPQASPADRHALDMLRRGYSEWAVRCAWAYGRFREPLPSALQRCQIDLGQSHRSPMQTDSGIELAPVDNSGHGQWESTLPQDADGKPHIGREACNLGPTTAY